jgi:hypothetical protein
MNTLKLFSILALAGLLLFSACNDDDFFDERDVFIGSYEVLESCKNDTVSTTLEIVKHGGSRSNEVFIQGNPIFGLNHRMLGYINGSRITLPTQAFVIRDSPSLFYEFSGEGLLAGNEIRLDYQVFRVEELPFGIDERDLGTCRLTMIKQ